MQTKPNKNRIIAMVAVLVLVTVFGAAYRLRHTENEERNIGVSILSGPQGGTNISTATTTDIGDCLSVSSTNPYLIWTLAGCAGGSGGTTTLSIDGVDQGAMNVLDLDSTSFLVTESPTSDFDITIADGAITSSTVSSTNYAVGNLLAASGTPSGLAWVTTSSLGITGGSGINNVVEDTSPQLGGDLDAQGNDITDVGDLEVVGTTTLATTSATVFGVGTSNPTTIFEARGNVGSTYLSVRDSRSSTGDTAGLRFSTGGADENFKSAIAHVETGLNGLGDLIFYVDSNNDNASFTSGDEKLRILANGNVGIGDASPASLLTIGDGDLFQVNSSGDIITQSVGVDALESEDFGDFTCNGTTCSLDSGINATFGNVTTTNATSTNLHVSGVLTGTLTGNADTATALAANGANCTAGSAPLGVDESGAVESCFDVWTEAENTAAGYLTGNETITLSGDITGSGTTSITTAIGSGVIIEPDLDADVAAVDGDFLQYDSVGTNFTWRDASETRTDLGLVIGTNVQAYDADLDTYAGITPSANVQSLLAAADFAAFVALLESAIESALDTLTNLVTVAVSTVLEIPNGTNPTADDPGEIAHDTTDNQLILDDRVIRTADEIFKVKFPSSSLMMVQGTTTSLPLLFDGYTATDIACFVEGGTSKVITLYGETITCGLSVTQDDGTIASGGVAALTTTTIAAGADTGAWDWLNLTVYGTYTRE